MGTPEFTQRLDEAVKLAEAGQKEEAEARLRELVAEGARMPKATMALGVICGERGDLLQRRLWLQEARRLEEANGHPLSLRLVLNLIVDALEQGEPQQALDYCEEALALYPGDGEMQLHHAHVLFALGQSGYALSRLQEACTCLRARLQEQPEDVKSWRLLAMAELKAEQVDAAIEAHSRALALDPNHLPSLLGISQLLMGRGRTDEAIPWLINALANAPDQLDAIKLNGYALKIIGDQQQAVELFRKALELDPEDQEAINLLGACLNDLGFFHQAAQAFRDALAINPKDFECRLNLGSALRDFGDTTRALEIFKELLMEMPEAYGAFSNLMFTFSISNLASTEEVLSTARAFWERQGVDPVAPKPSPLYIEGRSLRVGILSADVGSHVVGRFLDPLLRHHDPGVCQLDLISMQRRYEKSSEELIELADGFHSLEGLPMDQAREHLCKQDYDLIVDTSGYTRGSGIHLLAERCAPVQAHYIGYHATTGLSTIDWFIGDEETASPDLQEQFSERLYRLPRTWLAYPITQQPFPQAVPLMQTKRPVLGAFCQVSKITPKTLNFWAAALSSVPEAVLVLKHSGLDDAGIRKYIEERFLDRGVRSDRIIFVSPVAEWRDHVDHYNIIDIALDTTPWSSATTGFEALAMGVPLLAIRGNCMAARMSSSIVKGASRSEWSIEDPREYGRRVANLCEKITELRKNKYVLQKELSKSTIFDGHNLCQLLIQGFRRICKM